jgi:hypothetical protein
MEYLNPLNWFKKSEPGAVAPATAAPAPAPVAPITQAAGRRRRHTKKAGRRKTRAHRK